jgi:hypothetical protein
MGDFMSKQALTGIIVVLVALVLAMALNPSGERHRAAIREAVAERSPIAGALGLGALTSLVVEYHSVGVASYTLSDGRKTSVGAFGIVHVMLDPPEQDR